MFNKKFSLLFAGVALIGILASASLVSAAPLEIFIRNSQTIESVVNDWLASQKNIVVDQIKANTYGGDYAVIIRYRPGGDGGVSTRVKVFDSNALTGSAADNEKTVERRAQEFISLFSLDSPERTIRSADILTGSGPWDIFIVYDEFSPIQITTLEEQSPPIIEKVQSFIEDFVSPFAEQAPADGPLQEPEQNVMTTTDTSTTTIIEIPVLPLEEQNATTSLAAALILGVSTLFNNRIGELVLLFLILVVVCFIGKITRKWMDKK